MVAGGFGICIMPALVMNDIPYSVDSYLTEPDACRVIGLSVLNPEFMAPAVKTLYQHIIDNYQEKRFLTGTVHLQLEKGVRKK